MPLAAYLEEPPNIDPSAFIAHSANLIGAVSVGEEASVWYGCVLRADLERITIGPRSNVQDGTVIHLADDYGTHVGEHVTVGHKALLHACTIDDEVLVGMGAIVMDGAKVGARSIIGAGTLVTMGTEIPPGSLVLGSPGKVVKKLDADEQGSIKHWADKYVKVAKLYREKGIR